MMTAMAEQLLERRLASFLEAGFVVIPGALDRQTVVSLRSTIEQHRRDRPESWALWGESRDGGPSGEAGRWQSYSILHDTTAFDGCIDHPEVGPLVRRLLGPEGCLSTATTRYRDPVLEPPPPPGARAEGAPWPPEQKIWWQLWHREQSGYCLPQHRHFIRTLQVTFELDDQDASTHCLSIVPESLAAKKRLQCEEVTRDGSRDWRIVEPFTDTSRAGRGMWRNLHRPDGLDIALEAGTCVLWNNTNIHAGTVRQSARPRRLLALTFNASRELAKLDFGRGGIGTWCIPKRLMESNRDFFGHVDLAAHFDNREEADRSNGNVTRQPPPSLLGAKL